jgi:hypothetical protein
VSEAFEQFAFGLKAPGLRVVTAEQFAAVVEAGAEPLIGDRTTNLLSAGALAVVYGDGGAGKTTLFLDLAFHLATGHAWLDIEIPQRRRVLWLENEGPRGNFREKWAAKIDAWEGPTLDGHLEVVEEPWAQFTFENELHRSALAEYVTQREIDVVIVGPVATLGIQGGGTPAEVNDFVALVEQTRSLIGRPLAVVLIHHENRAGQISGAWERVPDTLAHVSAQGHGKTRLHWQKARWASVLHGTSWHLHWRDGEGFELEDRPEVTEETIVQQLLDAITANPGGSWTAIRDDPNFHGKTVDKQRARDRLLAAETIVNTATAPGRFNLWHRDDPAATPSPAGTARERLFVPPTAEGAGPYRSPVPYVSRNGDGNGTASPVDEPEIAEGIA